MSKKTNSHKLPAPRLQLRWDEAPSAARFQWQCHYELVLPLGQYDIRAEQEGPRGGKRPNLTELVVPIHEGTLRGGDDVPCTSRDGTRYYDSPYRDGAHAQWDAKVLGDLPIYVIAPDGVAFSKKEDDEKRAKATQGSPA